jgi:muramoyltetrapeptide carboxypeptidase LdcA involved in peptidoglycan recycling
MRPHFAALPPVRPGDRVAVVSPSYAGPADFPVVHERGLARLRELGLEPVEYPTTRRHSGPGERAADLMAAFGDPSVRAVLATIGGDDQLTVLPYLDPAVRRAGSSRTGEPGHDGRRGDDHGAGAAPGG